ncbi:MAG: rhodanese-like domain-containing protein [Planctomycetota bacterium]
MLTGEVNTMNNGMRTIRGESLWQGDSLHPDTLVLDVRTSVEFREAHIPGSTNMPLGDIKHRAQAVLGGAATERIALVCQTGSRAASACQELRKSGILGDLHVLDGGLASWREAGLPVVRGKKVVSLERQVRIVAGALIVLGVLLGFLLHPGFFGFSALVGAGLVFAGVTDTCGMALMLAKMPWNRAPVACQKG